MRTLLLVVLSFSLQGCFLFRPLHTVEDFPSAVPPPVECFFTEGGMHVFAADGLRCPAQNGVQGAEYIVAKLAGVPVETFEAIEVYWVRGRIALCGSKRPVPGCADLSRGIILVSATYREPRLSSPSFGPPLAEHARPLVTLRHELGHVVRPEAVCTKKGSKEDRRFFWRLESAR